MKKIKYVGAVLLTLGILSFTGCKKPEIRNTVLATEAMERAKAADAPKLAPREYKIAARLYDRMNKELEKGQDTEANNTALLVIDAANEAIRIARRTKENINIAAKSEK